mmetsp:Transcript_21536/g.26646  ORF Transcript_21536/g.26646 Transcript_21536/m.26646 type:complete len:226 (+) Transcript_21536:150-827(+)|eukprot:CAMPEP_0172512100 /NCGR_PEP_ID=MMETSP1066-20121228/241626_1 /TAXON_ID=671091 /ORGANISM="Coscinodiscus wailesii, Strain CCMP2513" /LENGTH=225 /DNA_ID=CAMNT_0013291743 /DNA_START=149 /DNA_END=826 /DNA_ORIENTATION=+
MRLANIIILSTCAYTSSFITLTTNHHRRSPFITTFSYDAAVFSSSSAVNSPASTTSPSKSAPQKQLNLSADEDNNPSISSFRESEILGLKLMQEGNYEEALRVFEKGMKLEGSKFDVIRTKMVSGPSPVGGSQGGTEGKEVRTLDEFELQAGHYNMACAHAKLGNTEESVENLRKAWENGFDNVPTIKSDPDLRSLQETNVFNAFLTEIQPKRNGLFNPFSLFGK